MEYQRVNILDLLDEIGEGALNEFLSYFSCPNQDVSDFLHKNAIEFAKQGKSVSYLVFSNEFDLLGYYTIAIKPISVARKSISKSMANRISRVSHDNADSTTFTLSAYLIAQLGKNFNIQKENRIKGRVLLGLAEDTVAQLRHNAGGVIQFLECEDSPFLLNFYQQYGYTLFDQRDVFSSEGEKRLLHQLFRKI